jgi:hypothetical protein
LGKARKPTQERKATLKLNEAIEEVIEAMPTAPTVDLAIEVLQRVDKDELAPLLIEHLSRIQRDRTREIERAAFRRLVDREFKEPVSFPAASGGQATATLGRLARERFALADGSVVDWLKATRADHEARISYLTMIQRQFNAGIEETIKRHKDAIALLDAHGVTCLEQLQEVPAT